MYEQALGRADKCRREHEISGAVGMLQQCIATPRSRTTEARTKFLQLEMRFQVGYKLSHYSIIDKIGNDDTAITFDALGYIIRRDVSREGAQ